MARSFTVPCTASRADVAAGKEDRPDDETVGRECQSGVGVGPQRTAGLILELRQNLVAEDRQEQAVDQVSGQTAAAPVAEQHAIVLREWNRARPEQVGHADPGLGLRRHSGLHFG